MDIEKTVKKIVNDVVDPREKALPDHLKDFLYSMSEKDQTNTRTIMKSYPAGEGTAYLMGRYHEAHGFTPEELSPPK